jgi:invasion protein IalB
MIPFRFVRSAWALAAAAVLVASAAAEAAPKAGSREAQATAPAQPTLLGQYGEWGAYTGNSNGRKVCFALGKPSATETKPANRPRDPSFLFISTRPAENVRNEVSVIIGYSFKPNSDATMDIGGTKFTMQTQADGAWIKNAADEARLIDSMRKAGDLVVKGVSVRGTESTDRYSLKGLAQAIDRASQECK